MPPRPSRKIAGCSTWVRSPWRRQPQRRGPARKLCQLGIRATRRQARTSIRRTVAEPAGALSSIACGVVLLESHKPDRSRVPSPYLSPVPIPDEFPERAGSAPRAAAMNRKLNMLKIAVPCFLASCLIGCALPKPHLSRKRSPEQLERITEETLPGRNWAYCGSSKRHHHFVQWRYDAMLGAIGRSSYLKRHRLPRSQLAVLDEFPRTREMDDWRSFSAMSLAEAIVERSDSPSQPRAGQGSGCQPPARWQLMPE